MTLVAFAAGVLSVPALGQQVKLVERPPDPHGTPRPARGARDVPLKTSIYCELGVSPPAEGDQVVADSLSLHVQPQGGEPSEIIGPGRKFAEGCSGWFQPRQVQQGLKGKPAALLAVYAELGQALKPATTYTVSVSARTQKGNERPATVVTWNFTTEAAEAAYAVDMPLDLGAEPVRWQGHFFSGLCNVVFCTDAKTFGPTYELMAEARKEHPNAWSYQRDFWMTGMEDRQPRLFAPNLPNIVRERETRRIAKLTQRDAGVLLYLEDFFGHQQYGIPSGRAVSKDYRVGDEVLIADGIHDARCKVLAADDTARTVLVTAIETPQGGWRVDYEGALPQKENPDAPGLFPPGGCYLRKFHPHGTPCYYWGRLDKEWDLAVRRYGRRVLVNFADAPGDLSRDGRSWTTVKDYFQWHEVASAITSHLIERYGDAALGFTWSIFNEPELGPLFWRTDWDELQKFYDYATDGILQAFEDRGYDSSKVFIGGLELGGIFGTNLKLKEFLTHCSPRAEAKGALPLNAAVADQRLDGKRSRRVETLCRAHGGKGAPCDFISIHAYNRSDVMAAKLIRAKEMALEIDAEYYRDLWVNSHESCPDWNLPPDEAAADSYLGNGYFPSWCADVVSRQLQQAAKDPRYARGETLLTVWPPPQNFTGLNAVTRILYSDDDGDGKADRTVTVPMPIFHALNLLSDMGERFWVLPRQQQGGHTLSGFASRDEKGVVRVVLFSHHGQDTQSRSETAFDVALDLKGVAGEGPARVWEYRFDREHNSYFQKAKELLSQRALGGTTDANGAAAALKVLNGEDIAAQRAALASLNTLSEPARAAILPAVIRLAEHADSQAVQDAAQAALRSVFSAAGSRRGYPRAEVEQIQKLAELRPTASATLSRETDGRLRLTARVAGNGLNIIVIRPVE